MLAMFDTAVQSGARKAKAAKILNISLRQLQRWQLAPDKVDGRRGSPRRVAHALTLEEKQAIIRVANSPEFCNLSPHRIVPMLADRGVYLASERTFYRILSEASCLGHRRKSRPPVFRKRPELKATSPNQVWSWDISYLKTTVRGRFLYLYIFMDIFSRKIVGWDIMNEEKAEHAARILKETCFNEGAVQKKLILHSDNGAAMKGSTMLATIQWLGILPSFSRPRTSNDNPYSESLFKTLKYVPEFPERPFDSIESAKQWVRGFVKWYNNQHIHSGINYVSPEERHSLLDKEKLRYRRAVYAEAAAKAPGRFRNGPKKWEYQSVVYLNPTDSKIAT